MGSWLTIQDVDNCNTLAKVRLGDQVAITNYSDTDYTTGKVVEIDTYKGEHTRWKDKRCITIVRDGLNDRKTYYEMDVEDILFKD